MARYQVAQLKGNDFMTPGLLHAEAESYKTGLGIYDTKMGGYLAEINGTPWSFSELETADEVSIQLNSDGIDDVFLVIQSINDGCPSFVSSVPIEVIQAAMLFSKSAGAGAHYFH
ncbi:MAG: hypothetical protein V3T17_19315 [Pseudomonadales bacterium]